MAINRYAFETVQILLQFGALRIWIISVLYRCMSSLPSTRLPLPAPRVLQNSCDGMQWQWSPARKCDQALIGPVQSNSALLPSLPWGGERKRGRQPMSTHLCICLSLGIWDPYKRHARNSSLQLSGEDSWGQENAHWLTTSSLLPLPVWVGGMEHRNSGEVHSASCKWYTELTHWLLH